MGRAGDDCAVYRNARAGTHDYFVAYRKRFYIDRAFAVLVKQYRSALLHAPQTIDDVAPAHYAALLKKVRGVEYQRYQHRKDEISRKIARRYRNGNEYFHCVGHVFGCDPFYRSNKNRYRFNKKAHGVYQRRDRAAPRENGGVDKPDYYAGDSRRTADYLAPQAALAAVGKIVT